MGSLLSLLAPTAFKLIGYWIEKKITDAQVRKQWGEFVRLMQAKGHIAADLRDEASRQMDELNKPEEVEPTP